MPKLHSTAPSIPMDEIPQIHNHQAPSLVGPIVTGFALSALALFAAWHFLVFLVDSAGYPNAERVLAQAILALIAGAIGLIISGFVARLFVSDLLAHRERMAQAKLERLRLESKIGHAAAATSRTYENEQRELIQVCYAIMWNAYDQVNSEGRFPTSARPWSRRNASQLTLDGETTIPESLATRARQYLEEQKIIVGNEINWGQYPSLTHVNAKLMAPPILQIGAPR